MKQWRFSITTTKPVCANCGHCFWYGEPVFHSKYGYRNFICQKCSKRETMPNIKITAEVDGKIVPLNTISTESFEAIKALEKPKEIPVPVARLATCGGSPRLLFRPTINIPLRVGQIYALDLKDGDISLSWPIDCDIQNIRRNYKNIKPL